MLRLKRDLVRNLAVLPQCLVVLIKPGFRQVQPSIKQGRSFAAGIPQEDPRLAVILLAGVSAPLRRHAGRMLPVLGKVRTINDEHAILLAASVSFTRR